VPVAHGFGDGFESFDFNGDISSGWSCGEMRNQTANKPMEDPLETLRQTAIATLDAIHGWQFAAFESNSAAVLIFGGDFWQSTDGPQFGHYGVVGNNFGQPRINIGSSAIDVPFDTYEAFQQSQMKQAVRSTLKALVWAASSLKKLR
jgi:hypothetical protein